MDNAKKPNEDTGKTTREICIIAAVASNGAIGLDNGLLYWLPNDVRRFRILTTGHTIIMGRKTFESLPNGPLPNRRNIVLSKKAGGSHEESLLFCSSLGEALSACSTDEAVYIIGGASIYEQALPVATRLLLTEVHDTPAHADTFFPSYDGWKEVMREKHEADERHAYSYDFVEYVRDRLREAGDRSVK